MSWNQAGYGHRGSEDHSAGGGTQGGFGHTTDFSTSNETGSTFSIFGISEARQLNYTGPQGDFNQHIPSKYSRVATFSSQLDWSGLVDNVFKEEIDKLATGYKNGKF